MKTIGFVGAGNMARALGGGIGKQGWSGVLLPRRDGSGSGRGRELRRTKRVVGGLPTFPRSWRRRTWWCSR